MRSKIKSPATAAVAVALTASALLGISAMPAAGAAKAPAKPNIVVIMSDDQRQDDARIMAKMNANFASVGTTFANSYVSYSLCCPSRTSFMTGQYMHNHGIAWNFWPEGGYYKLKHSTNDGGWSNTLPKWLQNAGYRTSLIGKFLNQYGEDDPSTLPADAPLISHNNPANVTEIPPGWDNWVGGIDPTTYSAYGYWLNVNGKPKVFGHCSRIDSGGNATTDPYAGCRSSSLVAEDNKTKAQLKKITNPNLDGTAYQTDVLSTYAESFIKSSSAAKDKKPFFLWLTPNAPHTMHATGGAEGVPSVPAYRHRNVNFDDQWLTDVVNKPSFNEADISDKPAISEALSNLCDVNDPTKGSACHWFMPLDSTGVKIQRDHFVNRRRSILGLDDMVDRVYKAVKKAGKLSNTIFVYTSDNGWLVGEHRVPGSKQFGFDESIRVPLVISGPGFSSTGGRTVNATAMNVDLAPTILKAAGGTAGRAMDGIALQNMVTSPNAYANRTVAIETGANPRVPDYSGIHNDHWHLEKIAAWGNLPIRYELYDLSKDPYEINAVQDDPKYASVLETLKAQLEALRGCKGRACDSFGNIPASP